MKRQLPQTAKLRQKHCYAKALRLVGIAVPHYFAVRWCRVRLSLYCYLKTDQIRFDSVQNRK